FFSEELHYRKFETLELCHRCPQKVCELANTLFEDLNLNSSKLNDEGGAFVVSEDNVSLFIQIYKPTILYYNITALKKFKSKLKNDITFESISFGKSKGLSFKNVLIIPTKEMEKHITTGQHKMSEQVLAQFYVATTRSRNIVAILSDKKPYFECLNTWS